MKVFFFKQLIKNELEIINKANSKKKIDRTANTGNDKIKIYI